jgi:hypothetical protein
MKILNLIAALSLIFSISVYSQEDLPENQDEESYEALKPTYLELDEEGEPNGSTVGNGAPIKTPEQIEK